MDELTDALAVIAAIPPSFGTPEVAGAIAEQFGLRGRLQPLVSERDQNFCLVTPAGRRYLVKVASALETAATTALQADVLVHLERHGGVVAPRAVRTVDGSASGSLEGPESAHALRLLTWIDGTQLESRGIDADVAARFGTALGQLDAALADMPYEGPNPVLLWDLQRVCELRPLLGGVDEALRGSIHAAIDDFENRVRPAIGQLPRQVIHGDANPENVLDCDGTVGFIDFSDIVRAPRVFDVAIAASYLRPAGNDPLALLRPFVAAYHSVMPLAGGEIAVLFDLVRARVATSITLLLWRMRERPEHDEYRQKSRELESSAPRFLDALDVLGRERFTASVEASCPT